MALIGRCEPQLLALLKGVYDVIPPSVVSVLSSKQLKKMVCGCSNEIDVQDWELHTKYSPPTAKESQVIRWFWEIVHALSKTEKSNLLRFCTSSSSVPAGGFGMYMNRNGTSSVKFTITIDQGTVASDTDLPQAHTCFYRIHLPNYTNKKALQKGLNVCIQNNVGFGSE